MNTGCVPLFKRHIKNSQSKSQNVKKSRNPVFAEACGEKKKEFFKHLNAYQENKNDENRANLVSSRSAYKKTVRNFNFEQDKLKSTKLLKVKLNSAKEYWKLLKESVTQLEFVFYVKTDVSPLLEWCSFVQKVRFWYSKGV